MQQREKFIRAAMREELPFAWLCAQFGVSRKTGYKWLERFESGGLPALADAPRVALSCPHRVDAQVQARVLALRDARPFRGPRKLLWDLQQDPELAELALPSASSIANILKRNGRIQAKKRHRTWPRPGLAPAVTEPNALWRADHKGEIVWDHRKTVPLTVTDAATRHVLLAEPTNTTSIEVTKAHFDRMFRECGLPLAMQSDNGPPFGSHGLGGLSKLSVWLIRLGITLYRSRPGRPTDNAEHERMHGAMELEIAAFAQATGELAAGFDDWRQYYNHQRPHEGVGMQCPGALWKPSERQMPNRLEELQYPPSMLLRRVRGDGTIKWRGSLVYLSEALVGEIVGIEHVDDRLWLVQFGPLTLAAINSNNQLTSRMDRPSRHPASPSLPRGKDGLVPSTQV